MNDKIAASDELGVLLQCLEHIAAHAFFDHTPLSTPIDGADDDNGVAGVSTTMTATAGKVDADDDDDNDDDGSSSSSSSSKSSSSTSTSLSSSSSDDNDETSDDANNDDNLRDAQVVEPATDYADSKDAAFIKI